MSQPPKKLSIYDQATIFQTQCIQRLQQENAQLIYETNQARASGKKKEMKWAVFWQIYNRLDNLGRSKEVLIHLISNYDPQWNIGKGE